MSRTKAKPKPKNKGGRPRLKIDPQQVEQMASIGCTNTEIAAILGCSVDTITRGFAENIAKGRESGRTRLRKMQLAAASKGNVAMLIWLGKQMLGQSDKATIETFTEVQQITRRVVRSPTPDAQ